MTFTDPPYNVPIANHVCGLGRVQHREFAMASGEMTDAQFGAFLGEVLTRIHAVMADGALIYACMDWRGLNLLLNAGTPIFDELKNIICWTKTNGGMGSLYRSAHELIVLWKKGKAPHINNVELGKHGRYRTNSWVYAGVNTFRSGRMEELSAHPTVKPCAMVMDAIKDCSKPRGIILDAFGGSGTTLIAAEKTKRRGYLVALDPAYVDVTIRRWEKLTGKSAIHAQTGLSFAEMEVAQQRRLRGSLWRMGGRSCRVKEAGAINLAMRSATASRPPIRGSRRAAAAIPRDVRRKTPRRRTRCSAFSHNRSPSWSTAGASSSRQAKPSSRNFSRWRSRATSGRSTYSPDLWRLRRGPGRQRWWKTKR